MKAGIFDPYLDILGGGERYTMTVTQYLSQRGWRVDVFWDDKEIKKKLEKRLGLNFGQIGFVENIFASKKNLPQKWKITRKYDLIFYLSDGSLPLLFAKKNILHFQVPFQNVGGRSIFNRVKLRRFNHIVCNSYFTKKYIDQEYGVKSRVIYPPVAVEDFKPGKKENIILAVGRFSKALHAKKQEVLIDGFKQLSEEIKGWELVLIGGVRDEDKTYIEELKNKAKGFPIEILVNVDFATLRKLYSKAKIFWHAAGFDENERRYPERMEHFGITVVEAMAAGCVPVVVGKGGIPEIIDDKKSGFLWKTKKELRDLTVQLIESPKILKKISVQSIKASQKFSKKIFCQKINELIKN